MYHFFIRPENVLNDFIVIDGTDVNHIRNVLRMKPGEELLLSDGEGHDYTCRIDTMLHDEIRCGILSASSTGTEPSVKVYLFQGLPKSDKLEHIIQKSVELGVHEIIPVQTARSIVKYAPQKLGSKQERWQKISESAAKQSRRGIIPRVMPVMNFEEALACAAGLDLVLIPYENYKDIKTTKQILAGIRPGSTLGIFVGPEGGFEQKEVERACAPKEKHGADARQISLGARILRTETAPLMLLSVILFGLEE
ncbi:MAG: 16S rRNA (uracil(1498)-N(3))-methyltransferase [Parasporobacterium sp.]|nr:16S rRNA (uracil(1498)-N(3))-methyltransferase [Parasporobacterium sp.]